MLINIIDYFFEETILHKIWIFRPCDTFLPFYHDYKKVFKYIHIYKIQKLFDPLFDCTIEEESY